jgi:hypothetical protein
LFIFDFQTSFDFARVLSRGICVVTLCQTSVQANGSKGGGAMSATEAEAMRAYVVKLQKKLKDTQQALRCE